MRNISFDNPWLLLLAVPLLAAVIVSLADKRPEKEVIDIFEKSREKID